MTKNEMTVQSKKTENTERTTQEKFYQPATDIMEYEDKLVLHMDMPGINKDAVRIEVEENTLKVETSFNSANYTDQKPIYSEYNVGPYARFFTLSTKIDKTQIEAQMNTGVLHITLPKKTELSRKISVS